jgi:hypothetical protein
MYCKEVEGIQGVDGVMPQMCIRFLRPDNIA